MSLNAKIPSLSTFSKRMVKANINRNLSQSTFERKSYDKNIKDSSMKTSTQSLSK